MPMRADDARGPRAMTPVIGALPDQVYGEGKEEEAMTHACGCRSASTMNDARTTHAPIHADRHVGEVAREYPGAFEVMRDLGINHCCGAGLTLAEAAA